MCVCVCCVVFCVVFRQVSGVWETQCSDVLPVTVTLEELTAARMFPDFILFLNIYIKGDWRD